MEGIVRSRLKARCLSVVPALFIISSCGGNSSGASTTFTIGGSISGLSTSGLVLQNVYSPPEPTSPGPFQPPPQTLTVAAGSASFVFPAEPTGTQYAVIISAMPTGMLCSVSNGTGYVESASVGNIVISCAAGSVLESLLYSFGSTSGDGTAPVGGLVQASDGNFYGTTSSGGTFESGAVYKTTPGGAYSLLYSFSASVGSDFANPQATLVQVADGVLYGTTLGGGANGSGTVFSITTAGGETLLYSFQAVSVGASTDDSINPSGLVLGSDGNLYGTTYYGGTHNQGTIFKITPAGIQTVIYSFAGGADGSYPAAPLIQASDGNFYGTTQQGGTNDSSGTVFRLTLAGEESVLYSFGASLQDANEPRGGLVQASDGNLYGTAGGGEFGEGSVYRITTGGVETVIHSFCINDGSTPTGQLIQGSDGNLYGTASAGGLSNDGTVYRITLTGAFVPLYTFSGPPADGWSPPAGIIQGADGRFYGTTEFGGVDNRGTVFVLAL